MKRKELILKISLSGMFMALGIVLPFLTGQIPEIGSMLCPMHIPVLVCGFVCGWKYGLIVGIILPILRSLIFTMPPFYPAALTMSFELAMYGFVSGFLFEAFNISGKRNIWTNYVVLLAAMIDGRIIWGIVSFLLSLIDGTFNFTFKAFLSGAFITAWPAIIIQLTLIPMLILVLEKTNLLEKISK